MATTKTIKRTRKATKPKPPPVATFTLPKAAKPSKACATDTTRPLIQHAYVRNTKRGPEIHATNSYVAARIPLTAEGDVEEGLIPLDALKRAEASKDRSITINGRVEVEGGRVSYAVAEFSQDYPDVEKLWRRAEAEQPLRIGLNPKLLLELAQALGVKPLYGVTLELDLAKVTDGTYLKPFRITPQSGLGADGAEGLLMPIRVNV